MREELRKLMYSYTDRYEKLEREYDEARSSNNRESMISIRKLQRQSRLMIAELWLVMVKVGALDEEEIEFGSIKKRKL